MIEYRKTYVSGDTCYPTLEAAQEAEIVSLLPSGSASPDLAKFILTHKDQFLNVLTMNARSRPRARAANGATRARKKKTAPTPTVLPSPVPGPQSTAE